MQTCKIGQDYVKNKSERGFRSALFLASEFIPRENSEVWIYISEDCAIIQHNLQNISKFKNDLKAEYKYNKREELVRNTSLNDSSTPKHQFINQYYINTSSKMLDNHCQTQNFNKQNVLNHPNHSSSTVSESFSNIYFQGSFNCFENSSQENSNGKQKGHLEFRSPCKAISSKIENIRDDKQTLLGLHPNNSTEYDKMMSQPVTMNTMVYLHLLNKQHEFSNEENCIEPPKMQELKHKAVHKAKRLQTSVQSIEYECNNKGCTARIPCRKCIKNRCQIRKKAPSKLINDIPIL